MLDRTTYVQGGGGGVSIAGLLGITFIILKLTGIIAWSWWWVLAPFWIPLAIVLAGVVIGGLIGLVIYFVNRR